MADETSFPEQIMPFPDGYAECIAHAANGWAHLEYYINSTIWALAGTPPALGACMTSHIFATNARLNCLAALLNTRKADTALIKAVNVFSQNVRDAQDARNRIVHDAWFLDNLNPGKMGKLAITADKKLRFKIETIPVDELQKEALKIYNRQMEFFEIRKAIFAALPSLPEIPHEELHPIYERS